VYIKDEMLIQGFLCSVIGAGDDRGFIEFQVAMMIRKEKRFWIMIGIKNWRE